MTSPQSCLRRATVTVLATVAATGGAVLVLSDHLDPTPSFALTRTVPAAVPIGACVAEENMRLIHSDRERCRPDEIELVPRAGQPLSPAEGSLE